MVKDLITKQPIVPIKVDMFTIDGLNDKQLERIVHNTAFMANYNHLVTSVSLAARTLLELRTVLKKTLLSSSSVQLEIINVNSE